MIYFSLVCLNKLSYIDQYMWKIDKQAYLMRLLVVKQYVCPMSVVSGIIVLSRLCLSSTKQMQAGLLHSNSETFNLINM